MKGANFCKDYLHKEYPKQFEKNQFWHQIKRTVNGEPVSEADIRLIIDQIVNHLDLQPHDHVLDLGCGNGALAARFFDQVQSYTGVDFSRCLLDVAEEFFRPSHHVRYIESDLRQVDHFATAARNTQKVLIYGCIAYLTKQESATLLRQLQQVLRKPQRILIGNIPNKLRAEEFFAVREIVDYQLDSPDTPIGVWWEPYEFLSMAMQTGFDAKCLYMPEHFYGGKYRFDALLTCPTRHQTFPPTSASRVDSR